MFARAVFSPPYPHIFMSATRSVLTCHILHMIYQWKSFARIRGEYLCTQEPSTRNTPQHGTAELPDRGLSEALPSSQNACRPMPMSSDVLLGQCLTHRSAFVPSCLVRSFPPRYIEIGLGIETSSAQRGHLFLVFYWHLSVRIR